jgi:hypothetical protein
MVRVVLGQMGMSKLRIHATPDYQDFEVEEDFDEYSE